MSEFNDPDIEQLLGRAGGAFPDVNLAYEQVQGRVRHARRRRAVVASSVACSLLFVTGLLAANRIGDSAPAQIGDRDTLEGTFPDDTTRDSSDDTTLNTVDETLAGGSVAETNSGGTASDASPPSTTKSNGSGSNPTSSSPTTTEGAPITSVFSGEGGSITVRQQGDSLSLVSYSAVAGYTVDVQHSQGDRVEVRFESSSHRTRIRIDLKNGSMSSAVEENET